MRRFAIASTKTGGGIRRPDRGLSASCSLPASARWPRKWRRASPENHWASSRWFARSKTRSSSARPARRAHIGDLLPPRPMRHLIRFALAMTATSSLAAQEPDWNAVRAQTLDHLQKMIRMNTTNPPGNEITVARYLDSTLKAAGIQSQVFEPAPGRGAVVARLKGNGSKQPVLMMGHMDVVGVERDKWTVDPFAAVVKDGYLYGRGSFDDRSEEHTSEL